MSNFQESGINFKFQSPQWTVVKYDEHLAHKKVSNALQPTKAVDFLGIHDNGQLFLIEVKNYRGHTHDEETRNVLQACLLYTSMCIRDRVIFPSRVGYGVDCVESVGTCVGSEAAGYFLFYLEFSDSTL